MKPKRSYVCLTCGVASGPMTDAEAEKTRADGHDLRLDETEAERMRIARNARARASRRARADIYDSLGMKRVRGALGGIYYE